MSASQEHPPPHIQGLFGLSSEFLFSSFRPESQEDGNQSWSRAFGNEQDRNQNVHFSRMSPTSVSDEHRASPSANQDSLQHTFDQPLHNGPASLLNVLDHSGPRVLVAFAREQQPAKLPVATTNFQLEHTLNTSFSKMNLANTEKKDPSRTLLVRQIAKSVSDEELLSLFQQYGPIHMLYSQTRHYGFVVVSYFDLRHAKLAMQHLNRKSVGGSRLDLHFLQPPQDMNSVTATVVVYQMDGASTFTESAIANVFQRFGDIIKVSQKPGSPDRMLVEFYDIRSAMEAVRQLQGTDVPYEIVTQDEPASTTPMSRSINVTVGGAQGLPSTSNVVGPAARKPVPALTAQQSVPPMQQQQQKQTPMQSMQSMPSMQGNSAAGSALSSVATPWIQGTRLEPSSHYDLDMDRMRDRDNRAKDMKDRGDGRHGDRKNDRDRERERERDRERNQREREREKDRRNVYPSASLHSALGAMPSHKQNQNMPMHPYDNRGSMSAMPMGVPSMLHSRHGHDNVPSMMPQTWGNNVVGGQGMGMLNMNSSLHRSKTEPYRPMDHSGPSHGSDSSQFGGRNQNADMNYRRNMNVRAPPAAQNMWQWQHEESQSMAPQHLNSGHALSNMIPPGGDSSSDDGDSMDSTRRRAPRRRAPETETDKHKFQLKISKVASGEDRRTTLMIRNIPNKYNQKMLLQTIDKNYRGTYDFFYLPIDFKNKCNVGYAFINFIDPSVILGFYEEFHGSRWEKFNSDKVCCITYGRIQGKNNLIHHFQSSSVMFQDKKVRPLIFHSDGPHMGEQEPFPVHPIPRRMSGRGTRLNDRDSEDEDF